MVQYLEKYKQNIAIDMRKRGFSYSEIGNRLHIPKSTLSYWLKNVKLTPEQIKKLNDKRTETAKANVLKKISRTSKMIEEIKNSSSQDIKEISKKELWLMGIMLYWKNGNKSDLRKGVHFSSSDPDMIKLFLKWLQEIGGIQNQEIKFDIFLRQELRDKGLVSKAIDYWSKITGFSKNCFSNIYYHYLKPQKRGRNRKHRKYGRDEKHGKFYGFLRVKVTQSSMLARQIAGWIDGIKKITNPL